MQDKIIKLRKGRQGVLRSNHPWIYKGQILSTKPPIRPGGIVSVINSEGRFTGRGYYNPRSKIAIRILSFKDEKIDNKFLYNRIDEAVKKRRHLLTTTDAYRAVFSEADSLPGLIIDVYGGTAVFQALTLGMENFKEIIVKCIEDIIKPKYIYEKSTSLFRKLEGLKDVRQWHGEAGDTVINIFEGRAKFLVDIENGHKTGFYLDQRKARLAMEGISKGKRMLDLFCYTGGFSISAALNGAKGVLGVDVNEKHLELAVKNAALNAVSSKTEFVKKDAFLYLHDLYKAKERFGLIVIDPPSFLRNRSSMKSASRGYKELNLLAMKILTGGGILATFSCSHKMPNEIFSGIVKDAAREAGGKITILKRCRQAEDHPIVRAIPETEYLKGYLLRLD